MNLALFDFDGTITNTDTFSKFIYETAPKTRLSIGKLILAPIVVGYKLGIVPARLTRTVVARIAFFRRCEQQVLSEGKLFAQKYIPTVLRKEAMQQLAWHKQRGDLVVVVSASLNAYLSPWCEQHGFQLLCSTLESHKGLLTGKYLSGDCSGIEKVNRINSKLNLDEFDTIYAYGDAPEDNEMLEIANVKYYQWNRLA